MKLAFDPVKRNKTLMERGLDERLVVMVWTPRGEVRRVISMRKANDREKIFYHRCMD
jgi:uncharacterized DUF497 family protein